MNQYGQYPQPPYPQQYGNFRVFLLESLGFCSSVLRMCPRPTRGSFSMSLLRWLVLSPFFCVFFFPFPRCPSATIRHAATACQRWPRTSSKDCEQLVRFFFFFFFFALSVVCVFLFVVVVLCLLYFVNLGTEIILL
jgi:hypothetical protein